MFFSENIINWPPISVWLGTGLWLASRWLVSDGPLAWGWATYGLWLASRWLAANRTKKLQFWPAPDQALYLAPELETRQSSLALVNAMKFFDTGRGNYYKNWHENLYYFRLTVFVVKFLKLLRPLTSLNHMITKYTLKLMFTAGSLQVMWVY